MIGQLEKSVGYCWLLCVAKIIYYSLVTILGSINEHPHTKALPGTELMHEAICTLTQKSKASF